MTKNYTYPAHSTERPRPQGPPVRTPQRKPRGSFVRGLLTFGLGTPLICILLWSLSSIINPQATEAPQVTEQDKEVIVSEVAVEADETIYTPPLATDTPGPDYAATQAVLAEELARLQATKAAISNQIDENKNLELQVTQQYLMNIISVEQQNTQNTLTVLEANAVAAANHIVASSVVEIAQATATAEIIFAEAEKQAAISAQETAHEIERVNAKAVRQAELDKAIAGTWRVFLGLVWLVGGALIVISLFFGLRQLAIWLNKKQMLQHKDTQRQHTTQTAPLNKPTSNGDMQNKTARLLSNSIAYWNSKGEDGRSQTQIPSYDMVAFSGKEWTEVTDYLVSLHIVEKKQGRGGGTFFKYGNLHEWMLCALNGELERVDPLKVNQQPPPSPSDVDEETKLSAQNESFIYKEI